MRIDEIPPDDEPNALLVQRMAAGDLQAHRLLYERHAAGLLRYLTGRLSDAMPAEELLQEVMVAAWRQAGAFRGESQVRTWLYGMAHHLAAKPWRRRQLELRHSGPDMDDGRHGRLAQAEGRMDRVDARIDLDQALRGLPWEQRAVLDLVLVIDSSLSMGERLGGEGSSGEGSKLEAARAAVDELLGQLDLSQHRVALVATDATARQLTPFGQDAAAVRAALAQLELGNGTSLDKGLTVAADLLLGPERRANTRGVILLLSDGRAHEAAPADAIAVAERARGLKLEVYTVGLGLEVDSRTLAAIADSPDRFQAAPDRPAVLRAFGRLAGWMDCPAEGLWGTR